MIWHPEKSVILSPIPENCTIHAPVWIGQNVKIGENVKIQAFAFIPDGVTIERDAFIGPHVCFTNDPTLAIRGREFWKETHVGIGAKIGANASIRGGVDIGNYAIVGMGAVVLEDVVADSVVGGNPAHPLT